MNIFVPYPLTLIKLWLSQCLKPFLKISDYYINTFSATTNSSTSEKDGEWRQVPQIQWFLPYGRIFISNRSSPLNQRSNPSEKM